MYCRVDFAQRDRNGGQSPPCLTRFVGLTWVPQLNTDLALFLKRQDKARLAANGHSP
jgi:hypothetical protein